MKTRIKSFLVAASVMALAACGDGAAPGSAASSGSTGGSGSGAPIVGSGTSLIVSPSLGLVRHASLRVLNLSGQELASGAMDDSGHIDLPAGVDSQGFIVELSGAPGASYYDEGMDAWLPLPAGTTLHAVSAEGRTQVAVTALTEIAYRRALHLAGGAALTPALINQANAEIAGWLAKVPEAIAEDGSETLPAEIPSVLDPAIPADGDDVLLRSDATGRYAIFLAGLARYAYIRAIEEALPCVSDASCSPLLALIDDLATDFSDGVLDDKGPAGAINSSFFKAGGNMEVQFISQGNFYLRSDLRPDQEIGAEFAGSYSLNCAGDEQPTLMRVLATGEIALTGPHGAAWLGRHSDPAQDPILEHSYLINALTGKGFIARSLHLEFGEPYYDLVTDVEIKASASGTVTLLVGGVTRTCTTQFTRGELNPAIPDYTHILKDGSYTCMKAGGYVGDAPPVRMVSIFPTTIEIDGQQRPETLDIFQEYRHVIYIQAYPADTLHTNEYWAYGDHRNDGDYVEIGRGDRNYGKAVKTFDMAVKGDHNTVNCEPTPAAG